MFGSTYFGKSYFGGTPTVPAAGGAITLSGTTSGSSSVVGALSCTFRLSGTSAGNSSTSCAAKITYRLSGLAHGANATTVSLTVVASSTVTLSGVVAGSSTASGALKALVALKGSASGNSTIAPNVTLLVRLSGTSTGKTSASGQLTGPSAQAEIPRLLTDAIIAKIALVGYWKIEVYDRLQFSVDRTVFTGDGVDDLDRTIEFSISHPYATMRIGTTVLGIVGGEGGSGLKPMSRSDLYALKDKFVEIYGSVDKINEYQPLSTLGG